MYLRNYNLEGCLAQPEFFDVEYLREKVRAKYEAYWTDMLHDDSGKCNGNKLRTYRKFKNVFTIEPYLSSIKIQHHRYDLTRFRTSSHKLNIETGRYSRPPTPLENRVCSFCKDSIEDEFHLFQCNYYSDLRDSCNIKVSNREEFYQLMSNASVHGNDARTLSYYIYMCFNRRKGQV